MKEKVYLGIDVGATFTKIALVDEECRLIAKTKISSAGFAVKTVFVQRVKEALESILKGRHLSLSNVLGMGIGLPGQVDFDKGIIINLTNIRGWGHFHLVDYLKDFFHMPIFIENDANCMALAEARMGAAKGASFALCLTLGTGVGGGLIVHNEIYRSPYFFGGEIGHMPVALKGKTCVCGGAGCLEQYVGNRAIALKAQKVFRRKISLEDLSAMAKKGHQKAKAIWEDVGCLLGMAIAGMVNVFNPQIIVIGGGVASAGDVLFSPIEKTVKKHAMRLLKTKIKIKAAKLGNDAGVLGAALLAKEKVESGCL
ncbi:MAG: ROK family protein [Candidatus Omnitrophota bacterium]